MEEYWDLFDSSRQPLHRTIRRGDSIPEGEYHIVVQIWTINDKGQILMTKRHPTKPYGSTWECTGGSVLADETSLEAARREYSEEIGITLNQDSFHLLTSRTGNRCFYDIYYVRKNLNLSELKLQEEEVTDACWYSMDEYLELCSKEMVVFSARNLAQLLQEYHID